MRVQTQIYKSQTRTKPKQRNRKSCIPSKQAMHPAPHHPTYNYHRYHYATPLPLESGPEHRNSEQTPRTTRQQTRQRSYTRLGARPWSRGRISRRRGMGPRRGRRRRGFGLGRSMRRGRRGWVRNLLSVLLVLYIMGFCCKEHTNRSELVIPPTAATVLINRTKQNSIATQTDFDDI